MHKGVHVALFPIATRLEDLLGEAQKVYIKRDEKAKAKARVMVTAIREGNQHIRNNPCKGERLRSGENGWRWDNVPWDGTHFYCKDKGHSKKNCCQRERELKVYENQWKGKAEG